MKPDASAKKAGNKTLSTTRHRTARKPAPSRTEAPKQRPAPPTQAATASLDQRAEPDPARSDPLAEMIAQAKARQIEPDGPGAPTLYRVEFCRAVIELGKRGYSKAQMAAALGVSRSTLDRWNNDHNEFCDAMEAALTGAQAWWEQRAHEGVQMPTSSFNAGLWSKVMSARFPADYRERSEVGLGGTPGAPPIPTTVDLSEATLTEIFSFMADRPGLRLPEPKKD